MEKTVNLPIPASRISAVGELLMIAAKSPTVAPEGMRLALQTLADLENAVVDFNRAHELKEVA